MDAGILIAAKSISSSVTLKFQVAHFPFTLVNNLDFRYVLAPDVKTMASLGHSDIQ